MLHRRSWQHTAGRSHGGRSIQSQRVTVLLVVRDSCVPNKRRAYGGCTVAERRDPFKAPPGRTKTFEGGSRSSPSRDSAHGSQGRGNGAQLVAWASVSNHQGCSEGKSGGVREGIRCKYQSVMRGPVTQLIAVSRSTCFLAFFDPKTFGYFPQSMAPNPNHSRP